MFVDQLKQVTTVKLVLEHPENGCAIGRRCVSFRPAEIKKTLTLEEGEKYEDIRKRNFTCNTCGTELILRESVTWSTNYRSNGGRK